jgi:hypothetical protein
MSEQNFDFQNSNNEFTDNSKLIDNKDAQIQNQNIIFLNSNEFIITFKYDSNFREILNFDDVYLKICEYIRIQKNQKQLIIQIENEKSKIEKNILTLFELEIKSKINKKIETIADEYFNQKAELKSRSNLFLQFTDMLIFNLETEIAYRTITTQERLILIFRNKSNEDKEIFELIEEYPDVEFICDDKIILDRIEFIDFQIKTLIDLKKVLTKEMFEYVRLLLIEWHKIKGTNETVIKFLLGHL